MQIKTIQDVVTQLTQITEHCKLSANKAGYFAALYKRMTLAVKEDIANNRFQDGARMEMLDIVFAQRYFDAYTNYYSKKPGTLSWQTTFNCCPDDSLIVLQHLLLGINTHINLDLAIAAAIIAPGSSIYDLQQDFYRINDIISSLLDDVQECLAQVWLPMRLLEKIADKKHEAALNFSTEKARSVSWANAVLLANMDENQRTDYISHLDKSVALLANKIKSPGIAAGFLLRTIRATEYDEVARTINLIDTTVVD